MRIWVIRTVPEKAKTAASLERLSRNALKVIVRASPSVQVPAEVPANDIDGPAHGDGEAGGTDDEPPPAI